MSRNFVKATRGAAALEFALVAPLLLLLTLGTTFFSKYLSQRHALLQTVRNAGDLGFRRCAGFTNPDACLGEVALIEESYLQQQLSEGELLLSYFVYDRAAGVVQRTAAYPSSGATTINGETTRFSDSEVKEIFDSLNTGNDTLLVAEGFYPIRDAGAAFLGLGNNKKLYETAVF